MTNDERSHIQQLFQTYRESIGDFKCIHIRFDDLLGRDVAAGFAEWLGRLRGNKRGTIRAEVVEEIRALASE